MASAGSSAQDVVALLQSGQLEVAGQLLAVLLRENPDNFEARHLFGVVCLERGEPQRALAQFDRAAAINPSSAMLFYNRGSALSALNRLEEAAASLETAIALRPEMAEAHYNRGIALQGMGRLAEAARSYQRAIAYKPALYQAHNNLGDVLRRLGRLPEALAGFEQTLALKPDHLEALNNRGIVLHDMGRLQDALASFDRAIAIDPRRADAFNSRSLLLQELGRLDEALAGYDRAIALNPDHADAWSNRGGLLARLQRFEQAVASCDRAIALNPAHAGAFNNRGIALHNFRSMDQALASYEKAISLNPNFAEAWNNRGNALHDVRRLEDALDSIQRAIALRPDYAEAINNRGMIQQEMRRLDEARADYDAALLLRPGYAEALKRRAGLRLLQGDFPGGWADFEAGLEPSQSISPAQALIPVWKGEDLAGKSILLSEPNGLGDTLQFIRLVPRVLQMGAQVSFLGPAHFRRILAAFSDRIKFVSEVEDKHFDFQCWLWSLPHYLSLDLQTVGGDVPYLRPEPELVDRWSACLDPDKFNIGICWQGNPDRKVDAGRSIQLAEFLPIAQLPGVRLISLQKNFGVEQLQDLPEGMTVAEPGEGFDEGPDAFVDSAALMASLDLVIASCTSVAHLAGALGRPTWLALGYVPDWRWMLDRSDSPWYPSVRLFRQPSPGDWRSVFEAMARAISDQTGDSGLPRAKGQP